MHKHQVLMQCREESRIRMNATVLPSDARTAPSNTAQYIHCYIAGPERIAMNMEKRLHWPASFNPQTRWTVLFSGSQFVPSNSTFSGLSIDKAISCGRVSVVRRKGPIGDGLRPLCYRLPWVDYVHISYSCSERLICYAHVGVINHGIGSSTTPHDMERVHIYDLFEHDRTTFCMISSSHPQTSVRNVLRPTSVRNYVGRHN